jgi:hypothetical protein
MGVRQLDRKSLAAPMSEVGQERTSPRDLCAVGLTPEGRHWRCDQQVSVVPYLSLISG